MTVEELRALLGKATVLPWRWHGQIGPDRSIMLTTVGNGILYIMGAKRNGMQGAQFTFWRRDPDEDYGWNGPMQTASEAAVREVPYRDDIVDIDNPNAQLIVAAVNALPALLDLAEAVQRLDRVATWSALGRPEELGAVRAALERLESVGA